MTAPGVTSYNLRIQIKIRAEQDTHFQEDSP